MTVKKIAFCGVLAPLAFVMMLIIFSILTPGYSNLTNGVSELGAVGASYALSWNIFGFIMVGLLITAFAWGLRLDLRPGPGSLIVPLLVAISGLGFAGLGFFPVMAGYAPSNLTTLHFTMVSINFLSFILLTSVFAFKLKAMNHWKHYFGFSLAMGFLAVTSFFIPSSIPAGVSQRFGIGTYFLWLFVIGLALVKKTNRART